MIQDDMCLNPEGIGLGLMICKTLTENMGGTVGLESEYGKGSSFWADLPLKLVPPLLDNSDLEDDCYAEI